MINFRDNSVILNNDILKSVEQVWEFSLPKSYRNFLIQYNGGYPDKTNFDFKNKDDGSVIHAFFGITPKPNLNVLKELNLYKSRIMNSMFPIARDVYGNLILLSVKGPDRGKVYFWDHEMEANDEETPDYSNLTLIADSFDEFINNLRSEEEINQGS